MLPVVFVMPMPFTQCQSEPNTIALDHFKGSF
jgi:hypothetical protein